MKSTHVLIKQCVRVREKRLQSTPRWPNLTPPHLQARQWRLPTEERPGLVTHEPSGTFQRGVPVSFPSSWWASSPALCLPTLWAPRLPSQGSGHCVHRRAWGPLGRAHTSTALVPPMPAMMPGVPSDPLPCWRRLVCWVLNPVRPRSREGDKGLPGWPASKRKGLEAKAVCPGLYGATRARRQRLHSQQAARKVPSVHSGPRWAESPGNQPVFPSGRTW